MSFLNSSSNGDEIVFLLIADGWQMKKLSKELLCKNHWILLRFFGPRLLKKAFFGLIQWSRERHLQCHNSPPDNLELDVVIAVLSSFTAVKTPLPQRYAVQMCESVEMACPLTLLQMVLNGDASPTPVTVKIETDKEKRSLQRDLSQHANVSWWHKSQHDFCNNSKINRPSQKELCQPGTMWQKRDVGTLQLRRVLQLPSNKKGWPFGSDDFPFQRGDFQVPFAFHLFRV